MSINKSLVSVFQLLQKYDSESKKFSKLANLYGTLKFNDKLLMKFYNDFQNNKNDISKLTYFKNTNIDKVFKNISNEDKETLIGDLKNAYKLAKNKIMGEQEHHCDDKCNHTNDLLNNKKVQKMLKKKGMKQQLQSQLGKQFGIKNGNVEDMLKSALKNDLPSEQFNMLNKVLKNPMVKSLTEKLFTEDNMNKFKDIAIEIMGDEELVDEINKIKEIFNEKQLMKSISTIFESVKNVKDITDISNIKSLLEDNKEIKQLLSKFETSMKSGLINEKKLMELLQKALDKFMVALKTTDILDTKNMNLLKSVVGDMGFGSVFNDKKEKKLSKEERRERRIKNNRRRIRQELKNKKKKKQRNNRKK